jgi:hypothetical protein
MKIQVPMTNAVRFKTGEATSLYFNTTDVDSLKPHKIISSVGPNLHSRCNIPDRLFPRIDEPTPYGEDADELVSLRFGEDLSPNYATTADSETPTRPTDINIRDAFRLSLFLRPDTIETDTERVLIAGIPNRFGLYQSNAKLELMLVEDDEVAVWNKLGTVEEPWSLDTKAWYLIEVEWDRLENGGKPMWFVNGVHTDAGDEAVSEQLEDELVDRFNLAHDPLILGAGEENLYWQGAIRELELANEIIWEDDSDTLDAVMRHRAGILFGLATESSPIPTFTRESIAWEKVGGVVHKYSANHPRATAKGTLVEEQRENLIGISTPVMSGGTSGNGWVYNSGNIESWTTNDLSIGRYTFWFEQENTDLEEPIWFELDLTWSGSGESHYKAPPNEPVILSVIDDATTIVISVKGGGIIQHVQLEQGADPGGGLNPQAVGPTGRIVTTAGAVIREIETLYYTIKDADLDEEQGRLDLEVTPRLTGPRAQVGSVSGAGDILALSLVRNEVSSTDTPIDVGSDPDTATLPEKEMWQAGVTRSFHVEWQPGTRLLSEDSMGIAAGADYSGSWDVGTELYVGGGSSTVESVTRANCFLRGFGIDDWVPRYHADLHRFMYRQFGTGGFSEDESSYFRKWRRADGDGLAMMARLGDRLKDQAFPDTVDLMLDEWEQAAGLPALPGMDPDIRRKLLADLFKALGSTDAEVEEQVTYLTGFAAVLERYLGDVIWPEDSQWNHDEFPNLWGEKVDRNALLRQMYEYYIKVPKQFYNPAYIGLIRWLLERREPAQTMGWPIVRTEFETGSELYSKVDIGPTEDDNISFEELESLTERDCVGLAGWSGLTPKGMWMPTNIYGPLADRKDKWEETFPDIHKPSVLFAFTETAIVGTLKDYVSQIQLTQNGSPLYEVHCPGILAGDRLLEPEDSFAKLNLRRGVELVEPTDFFSASGAYGTNVSTFNLGTDQSGAFLHVFRVSQLPALGVRHVLLKCVCDTTSYTFYTNHSADFCVEAMPDTSIPVTKIYSLDLKPGTWQCLLTVFDRESAIPEVRVYSHGEQMGDPLELDGWSMPDDETTFYLGGDGTEESAQVHHAYLAFWRGPKTREVIYPPAETNRIGGIPASVMNGSFSARFWSAFDDPNDLRVGRLLPSTVAWPVGPGPKTGESPTLSYAAKYRLFSKQNKHFPFAVAGRFTDGEGSEQRVRGYGSNIVMSNIAPMSEDLGDAVWIKTASVTVDPIKVLSPEDLTNACQLNWTNAGDIKAPFVVTGPGYVAISCWVKAASDTACKLFVNTGSGELEPIIDKGDEHLVGTEWKRIITIFEVSDSTPTIEAGLKREVSGTETWDVWGVQFTKKPILLPYVPNYSSTIESITDSSVMKVENCSFQNRGFVSFRIKLEELVHLRESGRHVVLFGAYQSDIPSRRAELMLLRSDTDDPANELSFTVNAGSWEDELVVPVDWSNTNVEHHIAIAWDLTRPIAETRRHIAMWVDGKLVESDLTLPEPNPMDLSLSLDVVNIGADFNEEGQVCGIFRELEIYTRHHPGVHTPTRLKTRA